VAVTHGEPNDADQLDPASRRVTTTVGLDGQHLPGAVAAGAGGVWVLASGGRLQRIDPAANQVVHALQAGPQTVDRGRLAVGAGAVWVSDADTTPCSASTPTADPETQMRPSSPPSEFL
jgi:streptogramin lyase